MTYIALITGIGMVLFGISFDKKRFDKMKHGDKYALWVRVSTILLGSYLIVLQFNPSLYPRKYATLFSAIYGIITIMLQKFMK